MRIMAASMPVTTHAAAARPEAALTRQKSAETWEPGSLRLFRTHNVIRVVQKQMDTMGSANYVNVLYT